MAEAPAAIGLDLGTTSCKAVVLDVGGRVLATAGEAYPLEVPRRGWAEQDVLGIWGAAAQTLARATAASPVRPSGLSLSGAMHSLLPVAADGTPLARAMTWADNRAAPQERALRAGGDGHGLYARTGCPVRSTYHPARLRWWVEEDPETARRARWFLGLKDWVLHALAGAWVTDVGLASTTGLLDIRTLGWDEAALEASGVAPDTLPHLVPSAAVAGGLTREAATATGLSAGLPVIAGGSDGAMANLGTGVREAGQAVITVGTSGAVRRLVDRPWFDPGERTWCYVMDEGRWFIGGAINNGGLALDWVRGMLYPELPPDDGFRRLLADAATVPAGADGVLLLPYLTGERSPAWEPGATATLHGLRVEHGRAHVARAAMEGVAACLADVWDALPAAGATAAVRLSGGITRAPAWAQVLADVLGVPLVALDAADASATGAAMLGLVALGLASEREVVAAVRPGTRYAPGPDHGFYVGQRLRYGALRQALGARDEGAGGEERMDR